MSHRAWPIAGHSLVDRPGRGPRAGGGSVTGAQVPLTATARGVRVDMVQLPVPGVWDHQPRAVSQPPSGAFSCAGRNVRPTPKVYQKRTISTTRKISNNSPRD